MEEQVIMVHFSTPTSFVDAQWENMDKLVHELLLFRTFFFFLLSILWENIDSVGPSIP